MMNNVVAYREYLKIYKKYSKVALGHGQIYSPVDALVEFKIDNDFIKNHIAKSDCVFDRLGFVREDIQEQVDKFVDELVEYTQNQLLIGDPDYNNIVDVEWICDDIEELFPTISCVVTKIPNIAYTHIPEEPNIDLHSIDIDAIREEIEQDEKEM